MDVLACLSVGRHVGVCADAACCNFRQLSLDIEHEGSELFDVDAPARAELILKICDQCSPYDLHLSRYLDDNEIKIKPEERPSIWPNKILKRLN